MHSWASTGENIKGFFMSNYMKTIEELTAENHDLRELLRKTRDQLTAALDQVAEDHKAKGEWHHRQFAKMCPIPDMSEITILK